MKFTPPPFLVYFNIVKKYLLAGVVGNLHRSAKYVVSLCNSWKDAFGV